mmetsp:Transcript_3743/g.6377  ORF Transcript_3743/g.6377 Transcript_3743/m.6377 type:complete len:278 (-) Transcript_3743:297-1130(-)
MHTLAPLDLDALGELEVVGRVQLVDEDLPRVRAQVQQVDLVVERGHVELVLAPSLLVEALGELLVGLGGVGLRVALLFLVVVGVRGAIEHLEVLVEDAGLHLDVGEGLRRALEVVQSPLAEAGLDLALHDGCRTASGLRGRRVHGALGSGALHGVGDLLVLPLELSIELDGLALVALALVEVEEEGVDAAPLLVADADHAGEGVVEELGVALGDLVGDALDGLGPLLAERDVVEVDLGVGGHEEVEVVAEDEGEAQDLLRLGEGQLDLLHLLLFEEE